MTNQKQKNIECIAFQNTRRLPILAEPRMGYENPAESNDFKKYIALTRKLKGFNMRYGEAKINPGFELYPTKKKDSRDWPDEDDSVGGIMMLIDEEAFMRSLEEPESKKPSFGKPNLGIPRELTSKAPRQGYDGALIFDRFEDFLKHLGEVVNGYVQETRKNIDIKVQFPYAVDSGRFIATPNGAFDFLKKYGSAYNVRKP